MEAENQMERIIAAKNAQGLTNQQLADLAGINKSTIYRIFGGKTTPDTQTLRMLELALGISDTPPVEPQIISTAESDAIRNLLAIQEQRVAQLRCYYNRSLAEKDRIIQRERVSKIILFVLLVLLVVFVIAYTIYDSSLPDAGWIRQNSGT